MSERRQGVKGKKTCLVIRALTLVHHLIRIGRCAIGFSRSLLSHFEEFTDSFRTRDSLLSGTEARLIRRTAAVVSEELLKDWKMPLAKPILE